VDGVTWQEYETGLENRLADLHGRVHRGAYRALPSRRVHIQKEDGRQRPLGVAGQEDKIVRTGSHGIVCSRWAAVGYLYSMCSTHTRRFASPPLICDKNRMR
jgi:hypothetical protein